MYKYCLDLIYLYYSFSHLSTLILKCILFELVTKASYFFFVYQYLYFI